MKLLEGRTGLVFGIANDHSLAWGIARTLHAHGAKLGFSYAGQALERRVRPLAKSIGVSFVEPCDVSDDDQIEAVFAKARDEFDKIDLLVHAIAFAEREELKGPFYNTSRAGFHTAMDISVYSLTALVRGVLPLMSEGGSIISLTHYGSEKVMPNYNVMGLAKAALEASTRYLAADLGPQGIRVNAISAGPVRTLSAAGVRGFKAMYRHFPEIVPLRRHITLDDVGSAAAWLLSDHAAGVTGEVLFVDSGYNIMGVHASETPAPD